MIGWIRKDLEESTQVLDIFVKNNKNLEAIEKAATIMVDALRTGNVIISCGNGGSLCDAVHFAEELTGRFRENRAALPAVAISDPAHITCTANDFGFGYIFSRYVEAWGKPGDVLLAITTSGNSENVLNAVFTAKERKMAVVALTGKKGGKISSLCDIEIRAPYTEYSDRAQEIHIKVIHALVHLIEVALYPDIKSPKQVQL